MVELKAKVPHDFWTKFVDSDRSDGAAEGPLILALCMVFQKCYNLSTLQMLTDKLLINYYFHMLLLQVKMCNLFKGG